MVLAAFPDAVHGSVGVGEQATLVLTVAGNRLTPMFVVGWTVVFSSKGRVSLSRKECARRLSRPLRRSRCRAVSGRTRRHPCGTQCRRYVRIVAAVSPTFRALHRPSRACRCRSPLWTVRIHVERRERLAARFGLVQRTREHLLEQPAVGNPVNAS